MNLYRYIRQEIRNAEWLLKGSDFARIDFLFAPVVETVALKTVDIQLNRFTYRFRRLTYREEFGLGERQGDDARRAVLALAMTEVSGMPITSIEDADKIIRTLPVQVRNRCWVLYRAGMPANRFFTTKGLYRAPDPNKLERIQEESDIERAVTIDKTIATMEKKFGKKEVAEAMEVEKRLLQDARRRGVLRPATPDSEEVKP